MLRALRARPFGRNDLVENSCSATHEEARAPGMTFLRLKKGSAPFSRPTTATPAWPASPSHNRHPSAGWGPALAGMAEMGMQRDNQVLNLLLPQQRRSAIMKHGSSPVGRK